MPSDTSSRLSDSIRDNMLKSMIDYSRSAMAAGAKYTKPIEAAIGANIDQLRQKISEAIEAAREGQA
jgi:hypothetical protein